MNNIEQLPSVPYEQVAPGVHAVDTDYVRPRMDASHLVVDSGRAAFVDTGVNASMPNLEAALQSQGLSGDALEYILLTHIHLDHAGGAGLLARRFPRAKVLVHPRGAAHLIDPAKLIVATKAVYGEEAYARIYGDILPIAAERVVTVADGYRFALGRRQFLVIHTPGHALHHVCYVDAEAGQIFSGDTFGVSYREFDNHHGEFIFATTTPTQFDPDQLHASVDRIKAYRPNSIFLTHYSRVGRVDELAADLHRDIDRYVEIARRYAHAPQRETEIRAALTDYFRERLTVHAWNGGEALGWKLLGPDIDLNAAGLDAWLKRAA